MSIRTVPAITVTVLSTSQPSPTTVRDMTLLRNNQTTAVSQSLRKVILTAVDTTGSTSQVFVGIRAAGSTAWQAIWSPKMVGGDVLHLPCNLPLLEDDTIVAYAVAGGGSFFHVTAQIEGEYR